VKTFGCPIRTGRGGVHPRLRQLHAAPASRHPPRSPATLSPTRRCSSPRSGWIPSGSLGELLQRLAQILHKRKNSRQVALPNLVIPSPAALAAPSAAISSPRSPQRGGNREERFCLGKHRAESTQRRPRRPALGRGPLPGSLGWGRCCRGPTRGPGGKRTPRGKQKPWHLVQWYRPRSGTQISLYTKNLVWRHGSVSAPGSTWKHLELGGQSLFAAHRTSVLDPIRNSRDLQPIQSPGTRARSHPGAGLTSKVTPKLAHPSPAMPGVGCAASLGLPVLPPPAPALPRFPRGIPVDFPVLIARSAPGWFNEPSRSNRGSAPPRLGSSPPGTARATPSPGITSRASRRPGVRGRKRRGGPRNQRILCHLATGTRQCPAAQSLPLTKGLGGDEGGGVPAWAMRQTPQNTPGEAKAAKEPTLPSPRRWDFSWVPTPELSQTLAKQTHHDLQPQQAATLAPHPPSTLSPKFRFRNQFPAWGRGTSADPSAHSFTRGSRSPSPSCAQLAPGATRLLQAAHPPR